MVEFEVEAIVGEENGMYQVRWKGFGPKDDTLEPLANLDNSDQLIADYRKKQPPANKRRARPAKSNPAPKRGKKSVPATGTEQDLDPMSQLEAKVEATQQAVTDAKKDLRAAENQLRQRKSKLSAASAANVEAEKQLSIAREGLKTEEQRLLESLKLQITKYPYQQNPKPEELFRSLAALHATSPTQSVAQALQDAATLILSGENQKRCSVGMCLKAMIDAAGIDAAEPKSVKRLALAVLSHSRFVFSFPTTRVASFEPIGGPFFRRGNIGFDQSLIAQIALHGAGCPEIATGLVKALTAWCEADGELRDPPENCAITHVLLPTSKLFREAARSKSSLSPAADQLEGHLRSCLKKTCEAVVPESVSYSIPQAISVCMFLDKKVHASMMVFLSSETQLEERFVGMSGKKFASALTNAGCSAQLSGTACPAPHSKTLLVRKVTSMDPDQIQQMRELQKSHSELLASLSAT